MFRISRQWPVMPLIAALSLVGVVLAPAAGAAGARSAGAASRPAAGSNLDWPQYLHGPQHSSVSNATAFTTSNSGSVTQVWHWQPPVISGQPAPALDASPTVVAGVVYIGAQSGGFYALDESTGQVIWSRQLDTEPSVTCLARGISSTAAVLPDPVTGTSTVYVSGARFLYALDAATGTVAWNTEIGPPDTAQPNGYYNWSSPTVVGGHIYVGLSSSCDDPLIRGGVVELDQHTGKVLHTWFTVPAGSIGGSIWTSVAASSTGSDVWVSTGNECDPTINTCPAGNKIGHSLSIVHLSASLGLLQAWRAPGTAGQGHDWDFGSSPTLFGSLGIPPDVGACNKNGKYYALADNPLGSSPLWTTTVGVADGPRGICLSSAVWNGQAGTLYLSGNGTKIGGISVGGSVGQVNPSTGAFLWHTGLPCAVMGTPSLDSANVLAAGTYRCVSPATPGAYLIDAGTGAVLSTLPVGTSKIFAQPVFAQGTLFVATESGGLYNLAPGSASGGRRVFG
jgi:polyvinyl alcohol dehydrogenase (cytochrome)